MKKVIHLNEEDIDKAVRAWLENQGYNCIKLSIRIQESIPGDRPFDPTTPASVSVECEVSPDKD